MNRCMFYLIVATAITLGAIVPQGRAALVIDTVPVGNAGNADDTTGFGGVAYEYRIGTYEVTNAQYAEFLNSVAATDPLGLYNANMGSNPRGGIDRSGVSGSFTYAVKADMGNKPVNYVSWYDAVRFVNWLHNGQGSGDTETGAYTLLGGTPTPQSASSITRNVGATWFLPSEDEWYKAAYHKNDGVTNNYFDYPTSSDTVPTVAGAIDTAGPTRGDVSNPGANVANYASGADWNGQDGNVTSVGTAAATSPYLTFDQGGNVWEWNEELISANFGQRGLRGASWVNLSHDLLASHLPDVLATNENLDVGFRVATIAAIPEASQVLVMCVAALIAIGARKLLAR